MNTMISRRRLAILAAGAAGILTALVRNGGSATAWATDDRPTVTLEDIYGAETTVPVCPSPLLCMWPGGMNIVLMFNQIGNIPAVSQGLQGSNYFWMQTVVPEILDKVGFKSLTAEEALEYGPELMLVKSAKDAEAYLNAGINTMAMKDDNLEELREVVLKYGQIFDQPELAQKYVDYLDGCISLVKERVADIPEDEKVVVYEMSCNSNDTFYNASGTDTCIESYIEMCGGILCSKDAGVGEYVEVSAEQILEFDPDIVLVSGTYGSHIFNELFDEPTLSALRAVETGMTFKLPKGIHNWRGSGTEAALILPFLGKLFYPDRFADIDMKAMTKDFYKDFYGFDMPDDYIDLILNGYNNPEEAVTYPLCNDNYPARS